MWSSIADYLSQFSTENGRPDPWYPDMPAMECIDCEGAITSGGYQWIRENWDTDKIPKHICKCHMHL